MQSETFKLPPTVEALAISKTGDVDVLEKMTLPFPKVESGNLIVKIEYVGVNFIDTYFRKGLYPLSHFPATMGGEAAGVIVALPSDPAVLEDPDYKRQELKIGMSVAVTIMGTLQTYVSAPWFRVYPTVGVPTKLAAAAVTGAITAISFFEEAYTVKAGDIVFIHAVAGGLGLLMTQLAKYLGATVIGTTSTRDKAELAKQHGADHVILYKEEDVLERVKEITGGVGVDVVYDGVGKDTFDLNFDLLRRKGTLVSVGNASGPVPPFEPLKLLPKNIKLLRPAVQNYVTNAEEAYYYGHKAFGLISNGILKINIFKEYDFTTEGVRQAHKDLVSGKTTGKLIIKLLEQDA
ncbi:hypothetical protein GYMLUDRAFT_41242 [Collybiopsis luxurians FD-317 M1]|uniref:Probable quinone oxidoreductase n=1 Tax=Collybiopsis luxurians FD-317 M1 TaxID=944289 RepID=A0A0D0C488_9AGAR|nr:hypothetical protein GYMLUDRAFT_41242 [Collybiopsis luxurians FD-317 M1]